MAEAGALREALRLAQRGEAEAALALRRHALGLEAAPDARGVDRVDVGARLRALAAFEPLRDADGPPTPAAVEAALAGLDLRGAPDLARAAERLQVAARAGAALALLERDVALSPALIQAVARVLRASPSSAAKVRSACVALVESGGVTAARLSRTLARLRAAVPELDRHEGAWLLALEGASRPRAAPGEPGRYVIAAMYLSYKAWSWAAATVAAVRE